MEYVYVEKVGKLVVDIFFENDFRHALIEGILNRDTNSFVEVYYRSSRDHPLSYLLTCSKIA